MKISQSMECIQYTSAAVSCEIMDFSLIQFEVGHDKCKVGHHIAKAERFMTRKFQTGSFYQSTVNCTEH